MSGTDLRAPLSVETEDLTLSVAGTTMPVESTGERLLVDVPTVRDAIRVARAASGDATRSAAVLTAADLTTELRVRGRTVLVLGADARPGLLSRELGVAPGAFRLGGALSAGGDGALTALRTLWGRVR